MSGPQTTRLVAHVVLQPLATAASKPVAPTALLPGGERLTRPDDGLYFSSDLVHEGRNGNGDVFTRAEMAANWRTLIGMPIDKDHDMSVDGVVGQIYDAKYEIEDGRAVIRVAGLIHRRLYPDVAWKVGSGLVRGVSMECLFEQGVPTHEGRLLKGVHFIGMAVCRLPADHEAWIDALRETEVTASYRHLLLSAAAHAATERQAA